MKKIILSLMIVFVFPVFLFAHEHRKVADKYNFLVGFLNEPAFSGQMNGIDLRISLEGQPVEGLEQVLRAVVISEDGKQEMPLLLRKRYKQPGNYAAYFLPTKPGQYIFKIEGKIDGINIAETFKSGPGSFSHVEDSSVLKFPSAS